MAKLESTLDPRFRRLLGTREDRTRLVEDVARAVVMSTEAEPVAATATKSALVLLTSDHPPPAFDNLDWIKIVDRIYAVDVPVSRIDDLAGLPEVEYVEAGRLISTDLDTSMPEARVDRIWPGSAVNPGLTGRDVVVGIIDYGLDFTLDDFRVDDGTTRVTFLWDQSLVPQGSETAPANYPYGVEYDAAAINAALQTANPFSVVRHVPDAGSHGTHVASIAAGNGRSHDAQFPAGTYVGAARDATIIFVQPRRIAIDGSFTDSTRVAAAISYIFEKAKDLGLPCVINMSLGQNGNSHDGESLVERAIDRHLETTGRCFVCAAGNEHVWRGHASGTLTTGGTATLDWRVGGGHQFPGQPAFPVGTDRTPNEMEIWYSSRDRFRVRLHDPAGHVTAWVGPGDSVFHTLGADQIFIASERFTALNGDAQIYIEMTTTGFPATLQTGVWKVELEAEHATIGRYDAFIERDARDPNNNFADQSFFDGASFDPVMTLGTPGTARRGLSVANYAHRPNPQEPSLSSSRGRTRDGRDKPEVAAPGTGIVAAHSLGGRSNGQGSHWPMRTSMSGTSMAAPHVAGVAALMFESDSSLSGAQIRAMLIAAVDPPAGLTGHDVAWGYGRLDAVSAVNLV